MNGRIIFHIDMNSFYASVEAVHHPEWRGKPLAIAGKVEERRGIVVTASYEARAKGVKAPMPVWEARRRCPELIVKTPDFELYREASRQLFRLLKTYTPLVEKVSIDEGYMDATELGRRVHPLRLAEDIQKRLLDELELPSSIGIAPNKFLAKMASDMKKPLGITVLRKRDVPKKLWPLPIADMHGVGAKTAEKLTAIGIRTIGDLAAADKAQIAALLGQYGEMLHERANGRDARPVDPEAEAVFKSISQSTTLPEDIVSEEEARRVFQRLAVRLSERLKKKRSVAYQAAITIRYANWQTTSHGKTVHQPLQSPQELAAIAVRLFAEHWDGRPIRLLGISVQSLGDAARATKQLDLFTYQTDAKEEPLLEAMQRLEAKYGTPVVQKGVARGQAAFKKAQADGARMLPPSPRPKQSRHEHSESEVEERPDSENESHA